METIYLLSISQKKVKLEDYRAGWDESEKEIKKVFCGDSWIETLEQTIINLGDEFLDYTKERGKKIEDIEQSELINLISEYDLKDEILTRAFDSKEEAENELYKIKKKAEEGYENYTLVKSSSDFDRFVHNDFLDVIFNDIKFEPYRGYWNLIRCYDATNRYIGSISDNKSWDIWFNKIKKLNTETFKEISSMIEEMDGFDA